MVAAKPSKAGRDQRRSLGGAIEIRLLVLLVEAIGVKQGVGLAVHALAGFPSLDLLLQGRACFPDLGLVSGQWLSLGVPGVGERQSVWARVSIVCQLFWLVALACTTARQLLQTQKALSCCARLQDQNTCACL